MIIIKKETILSVLLLLGLISCDAQQKVIDPLYDSLLTNLLSHDVNEIVISESVSLKGVVYLDAREYEEYQISHIKDALWVGYDDFSAKRLQGILKDRKVIVYCSVGYRSEKIAEKLVVLGYSDVNNLYGGVFEWVNEDYPVVDEKNKNTLKVHAYDEIWGVWLTKGEKIY